MELFHTKLGHLVYDEYNRYVMKKSLIFCGKENEIEIYFRGYYDNEDITEVHCDTYDALFANWEKIVPKVVETIIYYQNEQWDFTNHTMSFKKFENTSDVLDNTEFYGITIQSDSKEKRNTVLEFNADWVNDDYRLLSVELINEEVVEVTDQAISV